MINSQEIKIGTCIRMDGGIWKCIDFQHRKPGKGNTVMNTKLKNVADGRVLDRTFQVGFKLDDVRVEHRPYQYALRGLYGLHLHEPGDLRADTYRPRYDYRRTVHEGRRRR